MRPLVPSAPLSFTLEASKIIVTTHTPPLVPPGGTPPLPASVSGENQDPESVVILPYLLLQSYHLNANAYNALFSFSHF